MKYLLTLCAFLALVSLHETWADMGKFTQASFRMMDVDNNSLITGNEFLDFYKSADYSGNSKVNSSEFVERYMMTGASLEESLYSFFRFDYKHENEIDMEELRVIFSVLDGDEDRALNYIEYASTMNTLGSQVKIMQRIGVGIVNLFEAADMKNVGYLTKDGLWSTFAGADSDGSGLISKKEFVPYWMNKTGDNAVRSALLYELFQTNSSADFGTEEQKKGLFESFDYEKDGRLTKEEYLNAMVAVFARVMDTLDTYMVQQLAPSTINSSAIFSAVDTNNDTKISLDEYMKSGKIADLDGDGYLNYTELMTPLIAAGFAPRAALFDFFRTDQNHDDRIDQSEIRKAYHILDRNRDKGVTLAEYEFALLIFKSQVKAAAAAAPKLLTMLAVADKNGDDALNGVETWALVSSADTNTDGALTQDEFVKYWSTNAGLTEHVCRHLFELFDGDRDGVIAEAERTAIYLSLDLDHDGYISFQEFRDVMLYDYEVITTTIAQEAKNSMRGRFDTKTQFQLLDMNNNSYIEQDEYEKAFDAVDTSKDGAIDEYENTKSMPSISANAATYLFFLNDHNKDGKISRDEYLKTFDYLDLDDDNRVSEQEHAKTWESVLYQFGEVSMALERLNKLFAVLDANKDNSLEPGELKAFGSFADTNNDSAVSKDEFTKVMVSQVGMAEERADVLFSIYNKNGDGKFENAEQEARFEIVSKGDGKISQSDFTRNVLRNYGEIFSQLTAKKQADKQKKHAAWKKTNPNAVVG